MNRQRGFILPLTVLLVVVLGISGMSFMHLDYLERRTGMNAVDNHGSFYLANAGIERAREAFKIDITTVSWTSLLQDGTKTDTNYPPALCPFGAARGCVIPPFQTMNAGVVNPVFSPDMPFAGTFGSGQYDVRAFNDENSTVDNNGILIFRALGTIRGEQKLLEATVKAVSGTNLINCNTGTRCPNVTAGNSNTISAMPGRDPAVGPLPLLDKQDKNFYPLTDSRNYYRDETGTKYAANFSGLVSSYQMVTLPPSGKFTPTSPNTYYFISGDVTLVQAVKNVALSNVMIFSTGTLTIPGDMFLTNAILIGVNGIILQSGPNLSAPAAPFPNYPLLISGGDINQGGNQANGSFTGNIYAFHFDYSTNPPSPAGTVNLNPQYFEGAIFGAQVDVQGNSTYTDQLKLRYYQLMPGFYYPNALLTNVVVPGGISWREIQ